MKAEHVFVLSAVGLGTWIFLRAGEASASVKPNRTVRAYLKSPSGFTYPDRAAPYLPLADAADRAYSLPTGTMASLLYQESRYRQDIISGRTVSRANAQGIAQIVPKWHPGVDVLDPTESIDYAASYLRKMMDQFGTLELGLAAYNWGPGNLKNKGWENRPSETRNYVDQITERIA